MIMAENETPEVEAAEGDSGGALSVFITNGVNSAGLATVRAFSRAGHKVAAVVETTSQADEIRERGGLPIFVDITRPGEIAGMIRMVEATILVNTASQKFNDLPFFAPSHDPQDLREETRAIIEAAKMTAVQLLIHTSFVWLYKSGEGGLTDEDSPLSHEKDGIIAAARQAEQSVLNSGIPATILRAGFVYGPGSTLLQKAADAIQFGKFLITGGDKALANWIHAEDLASAILLVAEKGLSGAVLNIVDDEPASPNTFLSALAESIGLSGSVNRNPGLMAWLGLNQVDDMLAKRTIRASNRKARETLSWAPRYPSHREGIEQTQVSWRAAMAKQR
jgi:nucleoside-diphosphate-sugar epimerase